MNLQEIAAKLTGLETRFDSLKAEAATAKETSESLSADLIAAEAQHAELKTGNATLTEANALAESANATLTADLVAANSELATLKAAALPAKEAASLEAVEIAASQGAPASEVPAGDGGGATPKTEAKLIEEMAALPMGERHAFYQANRATLNPFK